jgi:hypothetical protein
VKNELEAPTLFEDYESLEDAVSDAKRILLAATEQYRPNVTFALFSGGSRLSNLAAPEQGLHRLETQAEELGKRFCKWGATPGTAKSTGPLCSSCVGQGVFVL